MMMWGKLIINSKLELDDDADGDDDDDGLCLEELPKEWHHVQAMTF